MSTFRPDQFLSIVRSCVEDDAPMDESMSAFSSMDDAPREEYVYSSQCNNCTDPDHCTLCCDSKHCNSAAVADIIQDNQIGQTCYECHHSEIRGDTLNPGCGLNFDTEGADVSFTFCKGLCYTAVTMIEVEEVQRGCLPDTSMCDRANQTVRIGDLDYEIKCCLGSLCNRAQSIGATTSIVLTMLGSYVAFMALAT